MAKFIPPADMDEECIALCTRLNELGDVRTFESCCGHLKSRYMVWFECRSFVRLAKLHRCVDRNYSDGKWEVLVDGTDVHPTYIFWLRSREVFETYEEMKESVERLIANIDYWVDKRFDSYFEKNGEEEDTKEMFPNPKWLYRLEFKDDSNGLWYNGNGKWCFNEGIGAIDGCKTRELPMEYDERYKQDGRDWFSSCSKKEDLLHWYSLEDAKKLLANGFVFTRYLAMEYHEYDLETVFIKKTSICREELDIFELFNNSK